MTDTGDCRGGSAWGAYQLEVAEAAAETDPNVEAGGGGGGIPIPALPAMDDTNDGAGGESKSTSCFQEKWENQISSLKSFKEKHGHCNVSRSYDKELGRFVNNQRQNYRKLLEGKQSSLTVDRIQELETLGFQWTLRPNVLVNGLAGKTEEVDSAEEVGAGTKIKVHDMAKTTSENIAGKGRKDSETWNSRLEQLQNFKEKSGHFRVPCTNKRGTKRPRGCGQLEDEDPDTLKLGKWVKRQRRQYATNQLPPERVKALEGVGFDFKPGLATKKERLGVQLGLLDALRKRRELSNSQVADLNFLYDEWKRRAGDRGAKPAFAQKLKGQDETNKFNIKWAQNFEQLKQFQIKWGHTRVPQNAPATENAANVDLKSLGKWVDYQRQSYWKRQRGVQVALNEYRITQLESIGFEWRIRHMLPVQALESLEIATTKNAEESCDEDEIVDLSSIFAEPGDIEDGENLNDHKWNIHYEELTRYKQLFGTAVVKDKRHPEYQKQLTSLSKWVIRQRTLYQNWKKGEKNGLTKSRVKRLEAIGFEFEVSSGKSVNFRGWGAKLDLLKAFKRANGHCRVPSRKKKSQNDPNHDPEMQSLAKWVEHQRSMFWKRAKGEKTSLSDERIAALNDVGMEWKLVHIAGDHMFATANELPRSTLGSKAGTKTEEEAIPSNDGAEAAEQLSAAHQVIDSIPDSIPQLAPASVDIGIIDEPIVGHEV